MFDQVPSNMQTSSSSPSSSHSSSEMYYTNVLFGHPLFAPSVLIRRNNENDGPAQPPTAQSERASPINDDFIELDVVSDSAPTLSGDEADQLNISSKQTPSSAVNSTLNSGNQMNLSQEKIITESAVDESPAVSSEPIQPPKLNSTRSPSPDCLIPQSSFFPASGSRSSCCDVFLMSEHDISPGNSITSTVVNLLRGCNLLDSHSLEDLCDYLPILRHKYPPLTSNLLTVPVLQTPTPSTLTSRRQQIQKKSSSLPSRLASDDSDSPSGTGTSGEPNQTSPTYGGRMVDYLLTCSRLGSTSLADFRPLTRAHHTVEGEERSQPLLPLDWRRGRSDGLVCVAGASRSLASRVMGRFITDVGANASPENLGQWLAGWIRTGAVIFFAQLDTPSRVGETGRCQNITNACCELTWRHRLVFGVTDYSYVHLSNPIEIIHVRSLMTALHTKTTICVPKSDLLKLWNSDKAMLRGSFDENPAKSDQDLSLITLHSDPRWCQLNILGQVIAILRERDWCMERRAQGQTSVEASTSNGNQVSLSQENLRCEPHLVVPCDQRPGFSLFLPRNASLDKPLKRPMTPQPMYS
ncbi:hypothetical protein Aperf_G00000056101 [Anoplocephala perfoliata]